MAISVAELALYRNIIEDVFLATDTCEIWTREWTADTMGGGSYSWSAEATAVPCRLVPRGIITREEISGGKVTVHDMFELSVHWDRDIDETMRVVIGDDTYEIAHTDDEHTERLSRSSDVVRIR